MLVSRRLILGAVGTLPLARLVAAEAAEVAHRLTVLHMNDFHSRHRPVDGRALSCAAGPGSDCFGGSARLATAISQHRVAAQDDGRAALLLDAGDQFQGSLFYTAHHGMAELAVQHAIGTEAMAVGNHEFDNGPGTLGRYVRNARFPVLSANIDVSREPALAGQIRPWAMIEKAGLKIAVIGLTTGETAITSSPGPRVAFLDPAEALSQASAAARSQGAQLIIVLSHLGLPADLALDAPGVAVIVGGHSHTLLSNDEPGAAGPHPTVSLHGPLIVQAQAYGRFLGRLDLDLAADGSVVGYGGACHHIDQELAENSGVAAIVTVFAAPLEALRKRPVGTVAAALDVTGCRVGPCSLGVMVAAALRAGVHGGSSGPVVGLMNAGGLRVGLPAGAVTLGQVLEAMPFGNTLATATVSGADLQEIVEHGLSMSGRGGYPQWAGLRVSLPSLGVEIEQGDGGWSALDPAASYVVATNNFIRSGGDGYVVLRDRGQAPYDSGPELTDLVADALARHPP